MRIKLTADKVQLFSYFLGISLLGSFLLSMPFIYKDHVPAPYLDALFTSVSAVCVTGLSTLSMDIYSTPGFIVIMSLIELGGLGLISFIAFYLAAPKRKVSLVNRTIIKEFFVDDVEYDPKRILASIIALTLVIEFLAAILLYFSFKKYGSNQPLLDSVFHSVSAFCNAGFSTYSTSLNLLKDDRGLITMIMVLIVSGGLGFIVLSDIFSFLVRKKNRLSHHSIVVLLFTVFLIIVSAIIFFLLEYNHSYRELGFFDKILAAIFQAITPRTAGFSVIDQTAFSPTSNLIVIMLMFIGGSPGSIAGGVKTTTFLIVVMYALKGNAGSRGLNIFHRNINTVSIEKAFNIIAKSLMIILISVTLLSLTERNNLLSGAYTIFDIVFESVSAFGTVGLSMGITSDLSEWGKIVIVLTMFIGRTGIVAMALGFIRDEKERYFEYPSASIMVG